jgi:imidazolonepropionase-like amidohydrolase
LRLLVDAGLTSTEAVVAATSTATRVLRRSSELGSVVPGKLADLVCVQGDPLRDVGGVTRIRAVFQGGRLATGALPQQAV